MSIENVDKGIFSILNIFFGLNWQYFGKVTFFLLILFLIAWMGWWLARLIILFFNHKKPKATLEVRPLRTSEQEAYSTQELFGLIHSIGKQTSFFERLFDVDNVFCLEIVSTKQDGIRYLITAEETQAELIKKGFLSYQPGVAVRKINKNPFEGLNKPLVSELTLANHFAFPLKKHESLEKMDPIAYLTGNMTKLSQDEMIAFQLVVSPLSTFKNKEIKRISQLIYGQKDLVSNLKNRNRFGFFGLMGKMLLQIMLLPLGLIVFLSSDGQEGPWLDLGVNAQKPKTSNPYQVELEKQIKDKLDQPMFFTSIRVLTSAQDMNKAKRRQKGFLSALFSMTNTSYQSLILILRPRIKTINQIKSWLFFNRTQLPLFKSLLSSGEISDLFHFPYTKITKTEDLVKLHSRQLPAPLGLKRAKKLDVVFAKNTYGGSTTKIGLTKDERRRHVYILGATGTGKSTMLLSMINQDLKNGKGVCVIDPHGDLIENILPQIPDNRVRDVVYFNPDDISYPMGINLLERTPGLNPEDDLKEKEFITESIISLFHKIYSDKYSGPRMEYILRNTIHTVFTLENPTLFTIYKLLINPKFRKSVTRNLTDDNLKDFWRYEFSQAGNYQKVKMISPITNKIGRFLFSPSAKRILEQEKSTINFDQIMDEGKILLGNVSKGKIGEDNSEVFGVMIMAKIQLAAYKRARNKEKDRKDFYLYVDEFQNFATEAFGQILSEARKYRLNAVLAHQTTSQIEDISLVNITLANTGTIICFRTANPEDEKVILPQFRPYVESGEISSLPSYHFYMRLGALNPEEPFSGVTIPVQITYSQKRVDEVIESSRKLYAITYKETKNMTVKQTNKTKHLQTGAMLP